MKEALTINRGGMLSEDIQSAGLEALLATSEDPVKTGRFLAALASDDKYPQTESLGAYGLRELGAAGREALIEELARENPVAQPKKLARLLMKMSKSRPPVPIGFWSDAAPAQRAQAAEQWKAVLLAGGEL